MSPRVINLHITSAVSGLYYTTWKGSMAIATPMYWFVISPYEIATELGSGDRHLLLPERCTQFNRDYDKPLWLFVWLRMIKVIVSFYHGKPPKKIPFGGICFFQAWNKKQIQDMTGWKMPSAIMFLLTVYMYLEDHCRTCKWLITMVIVSPLGCGTPSKWPIFIAYKWGWS